MNYDGGARCFISRDFIIISSLPFFISGRFPFGSIAVIPLIYSMSKQKSVSLVSCIAILNYCEEEGNTIHLKYVYCLTVYFPSFEIYSNDSLQSKPITRICHIFKRELNDSPVTMRNSNETLE